MYQGENIYWKTDEQIFHNIIKLWDLVNIQLDNPEMFVDYKIRFEIKCRDKFYELFSLLRNNRQQQEYRKFSFLNDKNVISRVKPEKSEEKLQLERIQSYVKGISNRPCEDLCQYICLIICIITFTRSWMRKCLTSGF